MPAVVSIDAIEPRTPLNVADTGSRTTAMPFTLSFGRSMAVVRVTGSVTSKPSIHSADSCGRVPPIRSRPSRPRTTAGSSGSDCKMRGRGAGRRCASGAVIVLPRCSIDDPEEVSAEATTSVDALARAMTSTIRAAAARGTWMVSKPSSEASTTSVERPGSRSKVPSPSVVVLWMIVSAAVYLDADTRQRQVRLVENHGTLGLRACERRCRHENEEHGRARVS